MVKLLPLLIASAALIGGCATVQPSDPDLLRTVNYVGDGWYVAALNTEHKTFVHARELNKRQASHTHVYENGQALTTYAFLRNWDIRLVNSSTSPVCASIKFLEVDYISTVPGDWIEVQPMSTAYVGELNQSPLFTTERVLSYDEAKWAVDTLTVIPYDEKSACDFSKK